MKRFRVLIVEDEPMVARFVETFVASMESLEVLAVCRSGEEAFRYVTDAQPEVLITDIRMRGMSGLELIRRVKAVKPDIQVIIISGYSLFEYAKEAIKLGIEDYILKPIDPRELSDSLRAIENLLEEQHSERLNQDLARILRAGSCGKIAELYGEMPLDIMLVSQSGENSASLEYCMEAIAQLKAANVNMARFQRSVLLVSAASLESIGHWLLENSETKTIALFSLESAMSAAQIGESLPEIYRVSREERVLGQRLWRKWPLSADQRLYRARVPEALSAAGAALNAARLNERYRELFSGMEQRQYTIREVRASIYAFLDMLHRIGILIQPPSVITERIAESVKYDDDFPSARESTWEIIDQALNKDNATQLEARIDLEQLYREICQYLETNCAENYTLQAIAEQFHVNQPYISKAFRTYANMSYKEFCVRQKIELAKTMIRINPNARFKDVALRVGIEPSYFGTVFHRITGQSPSEFKTEREAEL